MSEGPPDQPATAEFAQVQHVGDTATVSAHNGDLAIDTLARVRS